MKDATLDNLTAKICPLCGSSNNQIVIQLGKYTILRCKSCTNAWTYPPCQPQDYENEYFGKDNVPGADRKVRRTASELPRQWQKQLRLFLRICLQFCPPGGRVLDIGCGDGLVVEMLMKHGLRCEGIEPSREATELAIAAGLPVVRGSFPHPAVQGPFDLVLMTHVLEHILDPKQTLRLLAPLAPNGYLVLTQTNYRGVIPRTFGERWYAWCPEGHYYHFTPAGLRRMLSGLGYRVEMEQPISAVHTSRRHRYFLPIFDVIPGLADQFIMVARMPGNGQARTK
jgi:SAM-dependent methyltransferase